MRSILDVPPLSDLAVSLYFPQMAQADFARACLANQLRLVGTG